MYFKVFYMHVYYFNLKEFFEFHYLYLTSFQFEEVKFFLLHFLVRRSLANDLNCYYIFFFLRQYFNLSSTWATLSVGKSTTVYSGWLPFKLKDILYWPNACFLHIKKCRYMKRDLKHVYLVPYVYTCMLKTFPLICPLLQ